MAVDVSLLVRRKIARLAELASVINRGGSVDASDFLISLGEAMCAVDLYDELRRNTKSC